MADMPLAKTATLFNSPARKKNSKIEERWKK